MRDEIEMPVEPKFRRETECAGCGEGFDVPRDIYDLASCECGAVLCCDCSICQTCREEIEQEEKERALKAAILQHRIRIQNLAMAYYLGIL